MNYQSIKPTSTRGQLLAMVGWLCAVCGMLRCVLTVQRYEYFLTWEHEISMGTHWGSLTPLAVFCVQSVNLDW